MKNISKCAAWLRAAFLTFSVIILAAWPISVGAQDPLPPTIPELTAAVLDNAPGTADENDWTVLVENLNGSIRYYERNPDLLLAPASNVKLYTTAAAYDLIGPDTDFETDVRYTGTLNGGTVSGDIILVVEHDPTWNTTTFNSSARVPLDAIAQRIRNQGITSVQGAAEVWGAAQYNRGQFDDTRFTSAASQNSEAAVGFRAALIAAGVSVSGGSQGVGSFSAPGTLLFTHLSGSLTSSRGFATHMLGACVSINRTSHNAAAELLLRKIGYVMRGQDSLSAGAAEVIEWLGSPSGPNLDTTGIIMEDGSGLSRSNRFNARQTLGLIRYSLETHPTWESTLSINGISGTLFSRVPNLPAGSVKGKTGTLGISIAVSGLVDNPLDGERYLFSYIANRPGSIDSGNTRATIDNAITVMGERNVPFTPTLDYVRSDLTSGQTEIAWRPAGIEGIYRIYSGTSPDSLSLLAEVDQPKYFVVESRSGGNNFGDYREIGFFENSSSHSLADGTTSGIGSRFALPGDANGRADTAIFEPSLALDGFYTGEVTCFNFGSANAQGITYAQTSALRPGNPLTQIFTLSQATAADSWLPLISSLHSSVAPLTATVSNSSQTNIGTTSNARMNAAAMRFSLDQARYFTPAGGASEARFFEVRAVGANGAESRGSDVYGTRPGFGPQRRTIVVDGNDRWAYQAENPEPPVNHRFAAEIGADIPAQYGFDSVANELVSADSFSQVVETFYGIGGYDAALYLLGEESTVDESFSTAEQAIVTTFLNPSNRKGLLVAGAEVGWDLEAQGSGADTDFYQQILKSDYVADTTSSLTTTAQPEVGGIFDGLGSFAFSGNGLDIGFPDVLAPVNGSSTALRYSTNQVAGLTFGTPQTQRVVSLGFPVEAIGSDSDRALVVQRIMEFLIPPPDTDSNWLYLR